MSIDPELLRRLSSARLPEQQGVAALVRGIHSTPSLRDWVTLESVALVPIPAQRTGRWALLSLLTVSRKAEDGTDGYIAPWAAIEWSWPQRRVTQMLDLREQEEIQQLREQHKFIKKYAAAEQAPLDLVKQAQREQALFQKLDEFLANPSQEPSQLAQLASLYSGILPKEIYPFYWTLVPASKTWLRPDVPFTAPAQASSSPAKEDSTTTVIAVADRGTKYDANSTKGRQTATLPAHEPWSESPPDLSPQIGQWLPRALQLAESFHIQATAAALRALSARQKLPGFRLAFVGEFNRGKSTLINRLLGRSLLPVGVLPTTSTLTSILAGSQEHMEVLFPDGRHETRTLDDASWSNLIADDQPGKSQTTFPQVRVTLNHPWLREMDIELIDSPGAGDINDRRTALISEVLSQCDAAILLVSAILPVSLTEAAFLEQEVLGRHIPRVLVIVSMLDTLSPAQQTLILKTVRERVGRISPAIPVVPAHPETSQMTEAAALERVREHISTFAAQSDRRAWRSRQAAELLVDALGQLLQAGETALASAQMNAVQRAEALRVAQNAWRKAELAWDTISLQLDQRRLLVERELQRRLSEARDVERETLLFDLTKTPDPKSWWERDFPFRLRRDLFALARGCESLIMDALARDTRWLQDEVKKTFGAHLQYDFQEADPLPDISLDPGSAQLSDVQQLRFLSRVGSGAAMITGYMLIGPIGSAISIASGLFSEYLLNKKIEEQKQQLRPQVDQRIDLIMEEYTRLLIERLHNLYHQIVQDMRREQNAWFAAQDAALQQTGQSQEAAPPWHQLIKEATNLRRTILTALAKQ